MCYFYPSHHPSAAIHVEKVVCRTCVSDLLDRQCVLSRAAFTDVCGDFPLARAASGLEGEHGAQEKGNAADRARNDVEYSYDPRDHSWVLLVVFNAAVLSVVVPDLEHSGDP